MTKNNLKNSGEIETLYYFLYNAVLLGDGDKAKMYLGMLRENYEKDNTSFDILGNRFEHLKQLGYIVDNGMVVRNFNYDGNNQAIKTEKDEDKTDTEKDLVKLIGKNFDLLRDVLCATSDFHLYNLEHQTLFGRVDIVAKDNLTVYLIETKKNEARYQVIAQIEKYILDFKLKLILKVWNKIIGVVIANSFLDPVLNELVKNGVIPVKYTFENNNLKFKKLI